MSEDYIPPKGSINKKKVDGWINDLVDDAQYNFASYAECFISENLIRKYIQAEKIPLSPEAKKEIGKWKGTETTNKGKANISIDIRNMSTDLGLCLSYLSMDYLANLVDKGQDKIMDAALSRDATEYKPIRDALMHTALLTNAAKLRLSSTYENIKGRIKTKLSGS